jgi:hypothetical protein
MRAHSVMRSATVALVLASVAVGCGIGEGGTGQITTPGSATGDAGGSSSDSGSPGATDGGTAAMESSTASIEDAVAPDSTPGSDGAAPTVDAGAEAASDAPVEVTDDADVDATPDTGVGVTADGGTDAAPDTGGSAVVDSGAVCTTSATRCVGNSVEACDSAGQWGEATPCTDQTCVGDKCTGECAPTQMQCDGLQPQSCTAAGAWQSAGSPCAVSCTGAGVCTAPMCGLGDNGATQCAAGDSCCYNSTAFTESCEATCSSTTEPMDCMGNTGDNECGSGTVCCATMVLVGGIAGSCTVSSLTSSCQTTCAEELPGASCGSTKDPLTFTLRLCSAAADCADDSTGSYCCEYNDVPIYWCVANKDLTTGCK